MKDKYIIGYYVISIFLIANGAFATSIFSTLHMPFWRQLIWIVGLIILISKKNDFKNKILNAFINEHKKCFYWTIFLTVITLLVYDFNLIRLGFSWWFYFSGIPYVLFPFILRHSGHSLKWISYLFLFLGLFMSFGITLDYALGGFFTKMFILKQAPELDLMIDTGRFCFLSEAPTTFGLYLSFCLSLTLYLFGKSNNFKEKALTFVSPLIFILGAWFTGSRQIVIALLIIYITTIAYFLCIKTNKRSFIIFSFSIIGVLGLNSIKNILYKDESQQNRYSKDTLAEDTRSKFWHEGFIYCVGELNIKRILLGEAVALAQTHKALPNEERGHNYENTFWFRMSETGICGIYLLLLPIIYYLKIRKKSDLNIILGMLFLAFIFISYISPNGQHQTSQMVIYIAIGLLIDNNYYKTKHIM